MLRYARATIDVAATLLMIVAAGTLTWRLYHAPPRPLAAQAVEELEDATLTSDRIQNVRGGGQVVLIEFGDYECPFCARHQKEAGRMLTERFVDTGTIQHAFLNFPLDLHPHASEAAEAAECAGLQGKFWEMHDSLFEDQKALELPDLKERASALRLNEVDSGAT